MTQHLLALLGLSALCGGWVLFQGWLAKKDKSYRGYKAGCGACGDGSCESDSCTVDSSALTHRSNKQRKNIPGKTG